jgi:phosphoribosylpyrophosphate synthetase
MHVVAAWIFLYLIDNFGPYLYIVCVMTAHREIFIKINESVRGKSCFVIQTCAAPVNDNIMELILTITALKRSGAASVTAIIPYFGYKHNRRGLPMSTTYHSRFLWSAAGDLAKMLQIAGKPAYEACP